MSQDNELQWTEEELEALSSLAREASPPPRLEERTVARLRREGLLGDAAAGGFWARLLGRGRSPQLAWASAAAALLAAVFFAGVTVGQRSAVRTTADALAAYHQDAVMEASARVQQTGSAYVAALAALGQLAASPDASPDPERLAQGHEVALAALYAAADQLVRLDPDDPVAARILQGLEGVDVAQDDQEESRQEKPRQVMWF